MQDSGSFPHEVPSPSGLLVQTKTEHLAVANLGAIAPLVLSKYLYELLLLLLTINSCQSYF
jgi:hypothetical protein